MEADSPLLRRAYSLGGRLDETEDVYDEWASAYDDDLVNGLDYVGPRVTADRLAELVPEGERAAAAVLDAGCGTGLVGAELAARGFAAVDGVDLSQGMLDVAAAKGAYGRLVKADLTARLPFEDGAYAALTCVGTLTEGHVGPAVFDELVRVVRAGGHLVVPVLARIWESGGYRSHVDGLVERGLAELIEVTEQPYVRAEDSTCQLVVLRAR